jgi:hypothetical protein
LYENNGFVHNFLFKKRKKIFKLFFNFVVIREILVYNSTVNKTNKRLQNKQAKVCNCGEEQRLQKRCVRGMRI